MTRPFSLAWGLATEATKNVAKNPGWVPLAMICYVAVHYIPPNLEVLGFHVHEHREVVFVLATAILYWLGDVMDDVLFDDLTTQWPARLVDSRKKVKAKLRLKKQLYQVSLKIAVAAKRYEYTLIHVKNEASKFIRSLVVLSIPVFVAIPLWRVWLPWGTVVAPWLSVALTLALFRLYIWLKVSHMCDLYNMVTDELVESESYSVHDESNTRVFLWDRMPVSSGPLDLQMMADH